MATTKPKTSGDIEVGLAELSGIALCAGPGCYRQLKPGQGKQSGGRRFCFSCIPNEAAS